MPLSDASCKNAKPRTKSYKLTDGAGLYLEISPTGGKYWRYKYRVGGKEKRLAFGVYPKISLKEAREAQAKARKILDEGKDPSIQKKETRRQASVSASQTFKSIAEDWFKNYKSGWVDRHAQNIESRLKHDIYPEIGSLPIATIDRPMMLQVIRKIEKRGAHDIARRTAQYCAQIFDYALAIGCSLPFNPALGITKLLKPYQKGHFQRIEIKEIPEFLKTLEGRDSHMGTLTYLATKLLMLTLVRTNELIGATWEEVDLKECEWTIPAKRMKVKGRPPFVVPLSKQAKELLLELQEISGKAGFLFPHVSKRDKTMSNNTVLSALKRMGYQGHMTGHGFRSLGVDVLSSVLKHPKDIVDKCLAHEESNKVRAA